MDTLYWEPATPIQAMSTTATMATSQDTTLPMEDTTEDTMVTIMDTDQTDHAMDMDASSETRTLNKISNFTNFYHRPNSYFAKFFF